MSHGTRKPQLYVIAGPNGAGKTTFARVFLPHHVKVVEFVNADLIAAGISPLNPEGSGIAAGRLMLERIRSLGRARKDFAFETTLSGRSYLRFFDDLRRQGYEVHIFFLWLNNVRLAEERIANRVAKGGHNIPSQIVRRRFFKGLRNLFGVYQHSFKSIHIYDNSDITLQLIATCAADQWQISNVTAFEQLRGFHG